MSAENNCFPECADFNMVQHLTNELSTLDDKVDKLQNENDDLKYRLDNANKENKLNTDKLWIKNTFIEYLQRGGDIDSHTDIWDNFEIEIDNSHYLNKYEIFVMMLHEILGLFDYDLKTESEIREDLMYDVGEDVYNAEWENKSIRDILDYNMDENCLHFKLLPFENEGERVWWAL